MGANVVIIGAGGKMGARAATKLSEKTEYRLALCEKDPQRAQRLEAQGLKAVPLETALPSADFVVMAVPDAVIGRVARDLVPKMKAGSTLIMLDAAAAYAGDLPARDDLTYFITHPCHPALFAEHATPEARQDHFGGVAAQDILVSLVQGTEANFSAATELAKAIFAPVQNAHRVTPEHFVVLEPAMSEVVVASAAHLIKDALQEAIKAGVPRVAAEAFWWGHVQIALAMTFGVEKSPFSDAAQVAIRWGSERIFKAGWKKVFEPAQIREAIRAMLHAENSASVPPS